MTKWLRRIFKGIGIFVLVVVLIAGSLYLFGTMESPTAQMREAYAQEVAAGREPELGWRFHIPIPGCVCHSPKPEAQIRHSTYYLRECMSCHGRQGQAQAQR